MALVEFFNNFFRTIIMREVISIHLVALVRVRLLTAVSLTIFHIDELVNSVLITLILCRYYSDVLIIVSHRSTARFFFVGGMGSGAFGLV